MLQRGRGGVHTVQNKFSLDFLLNELDAFAYQALCQDNNWSSYYVGDFLKKLTGISIKNFIEKEYDWIKFIYEADRERVLREASALLNKPSRMTQEYRVKGAKGKIFWVRDVKLSKWEGDQFVVSGIVFDVSKQKKNDVINNLLIHDLLEKNELLTEQLDVLVSSRVSLEKEKSLAKRSLFYQMETKLYPHLDLITGKSNIELVNKIKNVIKQFAFENASKIDFGFSPQEQNIFDLVSKNCTQAEIAKNLGISIETVKVHVKRIKKKMNISGKGHLIKHLNHY